MRGNLKPFWRLYDSFMMTLLAFLMGVMVLIMFAQVVLRYVFRSPFTWAEETATYIFVWIVFLGGGPVFVRGAHIAVDYYAHFVPKKYHRTLNTIMALPVLAFLAFLTVWGWQFVEINAGVPAYTTRAYTLGQAYFVLPLGSFLMIVGLVRALLDPPKPTVSSDTAPAPGANIAT